MTEKLHDILERIYNQGCYAGESSHFDDWLYEEGCDRADYITKIIREALGEQTAVKESLITAGNDAESRFIDKACEWLKEKAELYAELDYYDDWANSADEDVCKPCVRFDTDKFLADFRKAMTDKTSPLFEQALANVNPDTRAEVRGNMDAVVKESLTTEPTWHKASEELPKEDDVYYVAGMGFYDKANWCKGQWRNFSAPITHWMPIPKIKED